jgi:hypothetical protein
MQQQRPALLTEKERWASQCRTGAWATLQGNFSAICRGCQMLPEVVKEDEMSGDNLENYINRHCRWTSSTLIPKCFDDALKPKQQNNKNKLMTSTLALHIGNHLLQIRHIVPNHPDWAGVDEGGNQQWWMEM